MKIIIVSPSLNEEENVSGVSSITNFIIKNNKKHDYIHFQLGKTDNEKGILKRLLRILFSFYQWKTLLKNEKCCIIHYNFPLNTLSILRDSLFMWFAIKKGFHLVIHVHGGLYLDKSKKPYLINRIMKSVFSWDSPFIMLSDHEKEIVVKCYHTPNVYSLPNCVDLSYAGKYKRNYEDRLDLLYLGRIEPNKGIDYILKASSFLLDRKINFVLHLAGKEESEGRYIPLFKKKLKERFVYEGIVSGQRKNDLLRKCNVFLLPSFFEGLPMSLLECMSYGMVPVTTNVGSIGVYVKDKVNGLIIKKKDSCSIVGAINYLNHNSDEMIRLSINARNTIFKEFSPSKYIEHLNYIYNTIL